MPENAPTSDAAKVRALVDEVVRAAAPRLGRVAVARISKPLTDAFIEVHRAKRTSGTPS